MKIRKLKKLLLLCLIVVFLFAIHTFVNQFNDAQIGLKRSLLSVQQKQTWIGDKYGRSAMEVIKQSEIGFACIYPEGSKERKAVIEGGQSLLNDKSKWNGKITPERDFLLHGSTTGINFEDLEWVNFEIACRDLEGRATTFLQKDGYTGADLNFKLRMQTHNILGEYYENQEKHDNFETTP